MNYIDIYEFPDLAYDENKKLVGFASTAGKNYYHLEKYEKAYAKLYDFMKNLTIPRLNYWAKIQMIDPRWCGATGTGAYWAVASRIVNEIAQEILSIRNKQWLLANLIAERDKIFNQISMLKVESQRKYHFSRYHASTNCEMIREISEVVRQSGKWHIP